MARKEHTLDLAKVVNKSIENTIKRGLEKDKKFLISTYGKEVFYDMQTEYRYYGAIFGINFRNILKKEILREINKVKEN